MKCDLCDNEATVREVVVKDGKRVERHLCEAHAVEQGISTQPGAQIGEIIKQYMTAHGAAVVPRAQVCPACRTTFAEFKQHGLLGCSECYRAFEGPLAKLLERAHEGGSRHVGKAPKRMLRTAGTPTPETPDTPAPKPISGPKPRPVDAREERLKRLRADLDAAVRSEQYEAAARLRDELKKLTESAS